MSMFDRHRERNRIDEQGRARPRVAGVGATISDLFGIDPTIVRIGFVALALIVSWKIAIATYVMAGVYLHLEEKKIRARRDGRSDYERMGDLLGEERRPPRASIKSLRETLDDTDRRMMAIDHHLTTQNDKLAREIEALREDK